MLERSALPALAGYMTGTDSFTPSPARMQRPPGLLRAGRWSIFLALLATFPVLVHGQAARFPVNAETVLRGVAFQFETTQTFSTALLSEQIASRDPTLGDKLRRWLPLLTEAAGGDLRQFPLSFDDEIMLAENFGYRTVIADTLADAIWKGLSLDLAIEIERNTWIRQRVNPEMAIEISGRVDLQKERGQEDLNIYRSIEVIPDRSTIKQFGRTFRIVEGVAQFNGPVDDLLLQTEADYEVPSRLNPGQPEVVVTLRLDGRLDDLAFNLSSDPALDNTDIVSYIATGRPASESLQFSDAGMNNQVLVGVAASQLAGLVEGVASQSLGLDVVSIEQDGLKGTRLTAGKYITPRLFVGVTQPFSFSSGSSIVVDEQRELTVEYEVLSYLLLQLLADASDSPVRLNLAGRYSY